MQIGDRIEVYETHSLIELYSEQEIRPKGHYLCYKKNGNNIYLQPFTSEKLKNGICCWPKEVKKIGVLIVKKIK